MKNKYYNFNIFNDKLNSLNFNNDFSQQKIGKLNKNVYNFFKDKAVEATVGHRFYTMFSLAVLALKSNVDIVTLEKDLLTLKDVYNKRDSSKIMNDDIRAAIDAYYNKSNLNLKYETLIKKSNLNIEKKYYKRNGRNRKDHLDYIHKNHRKKKLEENVVSTLMLLEQSGYDVINLNPNEIMKFCNFSIASYYKYRKHFNQLMNEIELFT